MLKFSAFCVVLIGMLMSVSAKSPGYADNATEARSLVSEQYMESSVVNDNICNNHEKNVAFDVILFDNNSKHGETKVVNKRQAPGDNRNDYKDRPRPDQKSLLIVFDATGSMHDDLEQLRAGAQEIVTELSARQDNPIYNYVLVVYRDPTVEPPFDTKNPADLLAKLKYIQTVGGGDCAEYALSGLKIALEFALPSSLAYVFSDATAKDLRFYGEVLGLIQKKQVTVNFLLTGNCDDPTGPGYQVYQKLSRASNGQVYDMNKSNVKDVLLAIRHTVNYNYAALKSVDTESAGTTNTKLTIDKSISELSVSLSGKNPQLTIRDPRNETIRSGDELSLTNLRLVKIKDPIDGLWNVEAGADSSHSIRLGAISELKFEFGFSIDEPKKKSETSFQPLSAEQNILSIFVSDPTLIKDLSDVTVMLIPSNVYESSQQFKIALKKIDDQIYATKPFDVPRQMFKVQLNGIDANGNPIERLISTGLHSSHGTVPDIMIEVNQREINELEKLLLKCVVKSHVPVNISWVFEGKTLAQVFSNQSNDLEFIINRVKNSNSGHYTCEAINSFGGERREISVKVLSAPKVLMIPASLTLVEGSKGVLTCAIESNDDVDLAITWLDAEGNVLQNDIFPSYEFVAERKLHNRTISCRIQSGDFLISNISMVQVEYSPRFIDGGASKSLRVLHGQSIDLDCETDSNPVSETTWFFTHIYSNKSQPIRNTDRILNLDFIDESSQGQYECFVKNSFGKVNRTFEIIDVPKGQPKIVIEKDVIIVNETDSIDIVCESFNSLPMTNFSWFNENSNNYQKFVERDEKKNVFKTILRIVDIDESDNGSFECYLANEAGDDKMSIELLVQTAPKVDSIMLKANDVEIEVESDASVLENDFISIDCVVDGFPTPDIIWYKDQEELTVERNETSLTFQNILERDAGHYQCLATNILGMTTKSFKLKVNVPPKTQSSNGLLLKVREGENVTLNCQIQANPPPTISWFENDKPLAKSNLIKDHDTLSFKAHLTDSGVYSCLGVNGFGSLQINFTVLVIGGPKILLPNDEQHEARQNSDLILSCDASGFPQPLISWSKEGKLIQNGTNLPLRQLKPDDSGAYVCAAVNEVDSSEKVFYVIVFDPPTIISTFENITLYTNQSKIVQCEASGRPDPEIYWTFDSAKLAAGRHLAFTSSMHSGAYSCVAENSKGKVDSSFFFTAVNKPSIATNYDELKKEIRLREGDGLELLCPFENFNEILWTLNNKTIESLPHVLNGNQLRLHKVDRAGGEWKCFVSNIAGSESFSFNVTVLASPVIQASWNLNNRVSDFLVTESDIDEKTFKVGETLTLNCTAQGFPKPKVLWKKATDVISEGESLVIEHLQFHHSDIYTCSAENDQGVVKKFFKIDVVSPPYIDDGDIQKSFHKAIGDSVTMRCRVMGNPVPNIFWFKDNVLIDDETEAHLEIKRVSTADDGTYKCIGKNSWGRETIEFNVSVMQAAKIIRAEEEQKITRNENSMKLSCIVQGNPLPVVSWILNGHILSTTSKLNIAKLFSTVQDSSVNFNGFGNSITYLDPFRLKLSKDKFYSQLTKLTENSLQLDVVFKDRSLKEAGKYQCYGYNALGRDEKIVEVKVFEKPFVNEKQMDQLYDNEVLEGLPLLLTCLISGEPTPKIEWFKGNHQLHENDTIKLLSNNRFLSIAETFSWNSGNYSCKGVNEIGEETLNFSVFILAPPRFIDFSVASTVTSNRFHNDKLKIDTKGEAKNQLKVMKGEEISLECFAEGSPSPDIHWLKMDFYDSSRNELLDQNDNVLVIRSIKESSNFMCYLNNTVGNIHKIFNVIVQFAPSFIDNEKPESHNTVKLHHGINLNCKVEGNPEPAIIWLSNGTEVSTDDKNFYFSNNNQVLRIINAKKSDQGKFLCVAENSFGRIDRVFYVKVEVPIQWSTFGQWSTCSVSCGAGGIQYRTRICLLSNGFPATADDYRCVGENVEARKCNRLQCPVNGSWGKFSRWSKCPDCVEVKNEETPVLSKRHRKCDSPYPSNGGLGCSGSDVEEIECNVDYCPINGDWSAWSPWTTCSKTCGTSHRMRKRFCNNPTPKHNGTYCNGENVEYEDCKLPQCANQHLKKSFSDIDEDDMEDLSNESRDKYGEMVEFEIKNDAGVARSFQFSNHREVEFTPPLKDANGFKIPKIKVTLDTYKPISEETYNQHMNKVKVNRNDGAEEPESTSFEDVVEFESTEVPRKTCMKGFYFNSIEDQCRDINECQNRRQHTCSSDETCVNLLGSFRCDEKARRSRN